MKEAIYIEGDACSKCYLMKPHVQKWCDANGYEFQAVRFDDESIKQFDVQTVPMIVLRIDGNVDKILNDDGIVNLLSPNS